MIFAAGLGTRLKPYTDHCPKAMVEVAGRPMIAHQLDKLRQAGFRRVVINVHHYAQQIVDYVNAHDGFGLDVVFSDESGKLLDTGGGIRHALPLFDSDRPVLIHNVDIFSNADLAALYEEHANEGADASLLVSRADATLLVLQPRKMPIKALLRAKSLVQNAGGQIMGLVMNNVDINGDTQYQYYTTYYSYYSKGNNRVEPKAVAVKTDAEPTPDTDSNDLY